MARILATSLAVAVCFLGSAGAEWLLGEEAATERQPKYEPRRVLRPFRPIVQAPFLLAAEVTDQVRDEELVLGVVVAGEARAYPINMLTGPRREIINDILGKRSIAATW